MLEVLGIYKKFKKRQILNGASFTAAPGQCIGIAGGNGCGKTTLLSILAGVSRPDQGSIRFNGEEAVGRRSVFEKRAAYVPQENPLIPELTARDNFALWYKGDKKKMERDLEQGVAKTLGISRFLDVPAGKLSGGQKKRLSIAAALSNQASLLIMDEPGAALDLGAKEEILHYIRTFTQEGGTVILTSHEMPELQACSALYILKEGVLIPESIENGVEPEKLIGKF